MPRNQEIDIEAVLAERRQIAAIWSIEDVQEIRPDLDESQAWEVLQAVARQHNALCGIDWQLLEAVADNLFGLAPEAGNPPSVAR